MLKIRFLYTPKIIFPRKDKAAIVIIVLLTQALGVVLIGVGAWLEVAEGTLVNAVNQQAFLVGPYLIIVVGIAIVLIGTVGMIGAMCDKLINRILLYIVRYLYYKHMFFSCYIALFYFD